MKKNQANKHQLAATLVMEDYAMISEHSNHFLAMTYQQEKEWEKSQTDAYLKNKTKDLVFEIERRKRLNKEQKEHEAFNLVFGGQRLPLFDEEYIKSIAPIIKEAALVAGINF